MNVLDMDATQSWFEQIRKLWEINFSSSGSDSAWRWAPSPARTYLTKVIFKFYKFQKWEYLMKLLIMM